MEKFSGNGAECMVRFIADGCKGTIESAGGSFIVSRARWDVESDEWEWPINWLAESCVYTPPEPVWREVTPGEALDAWLADRVVQRRADSLDDAISDGEWYEIEPRTSAKAYNRWNVCRSKFRIQEDA